MKELSFHSLHYKIFLKEKCTRYSAVHKDIDLTNNSGYYFHNIASFKLSDQLTELTQHF